MSKQQGGQCKICKEAKALCVDHCHEYGHVRGLLCQQCNHALGLFYDDIEKLRSAIEYLRNG